MTTLLRIENLYKDFSGTPVLNGCSIDILKGERHAVIGPNGAGKSTLFNLITGLYEPSRGKIFFEGTDITGWPIRKISRLGLSRSFQITNIFPRMTVYENVRNAIVSKLNCRSKCFTFLGRDKRIEEQSDQIVSLVNLSSDRDSIAAELSYGMQRQLELGLALALDPVLIMLDEPTSGLNREDSRKVVQLIREVTKDRTLLMVEHDMEVVFKLADRITVLCYGIVLASGPPDEIQQNEEVKKAYLGKHHYGAQAE
jgi:branched-chain amino acid transport system ATP-binding protein